MTEPTPTPTPAPEPNNGGASPSGFTPPASQEELNRIIGERVQRERAKFSDYEDLKAKAGRVDELEGKLAQAEDSVSKMPSLVAAELRGHLIDIHGIKTADADLLLTASEPSTLRQQTEALLAMRTAAAAPGTPRPDPSQGATTPALPLNGDPIEKALRHKLGIT